MDSVQSLLDSILGFMRTGFNETNQLQGLLIALAATIFMQSWRQWFGIALLAVVVHVAVDLIVPVLAGGQEFRLPQFFESAFWMQSLARYVGYLIVIGIFFAVKRVLFKGKAAAAH
ncbi:MAG: hypothetical protein ABW199_02985 [Caulobacterales bacterium]